MVSNPRTAWSSFPLQELGALPVLWSLRLKEKQIVDTFQVLSAFAISEIVRDLLLVFPCFHRKVRDYITWARYRGE